MDYDQKRALHAKRVVSAEELGYIETVLNRFDRELPEHPFERSALVLRFMEVQRTAPLNLKAMAEWDRLVDIAHDIGGMMNKWDSEKLEFKDCFCPRFLKEQQ